MNIAETWGSELYAALRDRRTVAPLIARDPSLTIDNAYAISLDFLSRRLADGERVWYTPPPGCGTRTRCSPAQSAAVSAIPGVAFSGSVDGHMRAYSTVDGAIIWDFDSIRDYETVNGVPGRGGSIDGPGPVIGSGMLFINSGYPTAGGTPGNVLLAFSVDGN